MLFHLLVRMSPTLEAPFWAGVKEPRKDSLALSAVVPMVTTKLMSLTVGLGSGVELLLVTLTVTFSPL